MRLTDHNEHILRDRDISYFCRPSADVAKLVDALSSGGSVFGHGGSSPLIRSQNPAPGHSGPGFFLFFFETLISRKTTHPIPVQFERARYAQKKAHLSLLPNQIHILCPTCETTVQLIGHLGADPEIKEFNEGKKLARISMATNESYRKQSGERVNDTQWHNVVAWGPQAEFT